MTEQNQNSYVDFDCEHDDGVSRYTYADDVAKRANELGFVTRPRPRFDADHEGIYPTMRAGDYFDGRLPTSIKKLSLDHLSDLQVLFSNWYGYVAFQTKIVASERSEALRQKEFTWSLIRELKKWDPDNSGRKRTDQQRSDAARFDIRFVKANSRYEQLNSLLNIMETVVDVAEQDLKSIDREISLRQSAMKSTRDMGQQHMRMNQTQRISRDQFSNERDSERSNADVNSTVRRRSLLIR